MKDSSMKFGLAATLLIAWAATVSALPIRADLLANEKLAGSKTFCVSFKTTQPEGSGFYVNMAFGALSSGFLEVNGQRKLRWRNVEAKKEQNYQTTFKSGVISITIGVDSEVPVKYLSAVGYDQHGVTEIREVTCASAAK